jgi:hypothetical protein
MPSRFARLSSSDAELLNANAFQFVHLEISRSARLKNFQAGIFLLICHYTPIDFHKFTVFETYSFFSSSTGVWPCLQPS